MYRTLPHPSDRMRPRVAFCLHQWPSSAVMQIIRIEGPPSCPFGRPRGVSAVADVARRA